MSDSKTIILQKLFPASGITVGYIGNCGPGFDDRSWRVFTTLPTVGVWGKTTINVHIPGPDFDVADVVTQLNTWGAK